MHSPKGQTLIESLIAITIIVVGIVSLIGLLVNSRAQSKLTEDEALVMELSAEAIEAARFVRDSNWLQMEDGDTSVNYSDELRSGTNYNGIYRWARGSTDPNVAITFQFLSGGDITATQAIVYQDISGYYRQTQAASPPAGWQATKFRRWVSLYPICYYTTGPSTYQEFILANDTEHCSDAGYDYTEVGTQVIVHMQWQARGETHDRYFEERLYNWKYADPQP